MLIRTLRTVHPQFDEKTQTPRGPMHQQQDADECGSGMLRHEE